MNPDNFLITIAILLVVIIILTLRIIGLTIQKKYFEKTSDNFKNGIEKMGHFLDKKNLVSQYQEFYKGEVTKFD